SVPPGASFNPTSYQFTWNVSTYTNISIQIVAKDSKNAASIYSPAQIIMCYCANGGTCDYTCANFPCYENVTCTDNVAPLTGYTCGSCPQGYTGDGILCSDFDECASSATNNCQQVCVNTIGGYTCDCQSGYQLNADGKTCLDADECFKNSQICGQICTNTNGSYICSCHSGFNLNSDNKSCIAATTCSSNNNCSESCTLINGKDQCACKNGYILQPDGVSCKDRDECADKIDTCQMLCNNTIGGYQCSCSSGYSLNVDGKTCSDINECSTFNACHSNANCQNTPGSYTCSCNSGYTGNGKTCTDINECSSSSTCGNNANCFNSAGSYNCQCKPGFYSTSSSSNMLNGNSCQKETAYELTVRIDATFNAQFNDKNSAAYKNEISKLQAAILSAYQNDSRTSNEVKIVTITNLRQGSIIADCIVTVLKNYTQGTNLLKDIIHTGSVSNYVVQSINVTDYNECNNLQDYSCIGNQQCVNTMGSYTCNCSAGYQFNPTLQRCIDINECQKSVSPCHQNSNCINTAGSYQCQCKNGYIGDGKLNCTLVCTSNYCSGQGICYVVNNAPRCNCTTPGASGDRCVRGSVSLSFVGISLGSIIGILLIIGFIFLLYRHNKAKTRRSITPDHHDLLTSQKSPKIAYEDHDRQEYQC
ncbi:Latent-transforming growth factor beta-binding protein 1, partial [Trichoplax sp. H2]